MAAETITLSDDDDDAVNVVHGDVRRVTHVFLVWLGRNPPKQRLSGLQSTVQRLGGRMVPYESGFTRQATHCVIATETADQVSYQAKVIGCLATGRHLVTEEYLIESGKAGYFIGKDRIKAFMPKWALMAKSIVDFKGGSLFRGWTVAVIMENERKKAELEEILQVGGAQVAQYTPKDLTQIDAKIINNLSMIFTEPMFLTDDYYFKNFYNSKTRGNWKVGVYSYYYLYKYVADPRPTETRNLDYFEISNPRIRDTIHRRVRPKHGGGGDPYQHPSQDYQGPIRGIVTESKRSLSGRWPPVKQEPQIKRPKLEYNNGGVVETIDLCGDDEVDRKPQARPQRRKLQRVCMPKQEVKVEKKVGGDAVIDLCSSEDDSDSEVDVIEDVGDEKEVVVLDAHDYVVDPEPSDDDDDDEVYFLSSSEESDDDKKQQDDSEDEETDYEPESEDVCNDEEKFIPRRRMVAPSKESTSGDAASAQDTLDQDNKPPTPMDTVEKDETDETEQDQTMADATPETEKAAPDKEKEEMDVVESQASQETTVTSVTSMMTSDEPKETTMTATSEEPPKRATAKKRRKTAAPLHADVGDRTTLLRAVNTLTIRQRKSNECIDIENVRARTFRFNKTYSKKQQQQRMANAVSKALSSEEAYQAFELWRPDSGASSDGGASSSSSSNIKSFLFSLEDIGARVNVAYYPPVETMHAIFLDYLCDASAPSVVSNAAFEFLNRVLCLHLPQTVRGRHYQLAFLRRKDDFKKPGDLPDGFPGSDDFWNLFKHVVQGRRLLALEYVILVIQRDLEYFLKHTGCRKTCSEERPIALHLLGGDQKADSNLRERLTKMTEALFEAAEAGETRVASLLIKAIAMVALLTAKVDRDKKVTDLGRKDGLRWKAAKAVSSAFVEKYSSDDDDSEKISGEEERRRSNLLFAQLTMLRPPWLAMSVAAAVCDVSSVERPSDITKLTKVDKIREEEGDANSGNQERRYRDELVRAVTLRKTFAAVPVHALQAAMAAEQKRKGQRSSSKQMSTSAKVPFRRMSRLDSAMATTHGESVRLDSGVSLPVEDVAAGVDAVNAHIRAVAERKESKIREASRKEEGEEKDEEGELCSMLTVLAFGATKC